MGKFGPRKQGAKRFVQEMVDDIAAKRRWVAKALGIHEDDPGLTRRIEEIGQLRHPGPVFAQQGTAQMQREQQRMQRRAQQPPAVAVTSDGTWLEVEMVKTLNVGRSLLHSVHHEPGKTRR